MPYRYGEPWGKEYDEYDQNKVCETLRELKNEQGGGKAELLTGLPSADSMESRTCTVALIFMVMHYSISPI